MQAVTSGPVAVAKAAVASASSAYDQVRLRTSELSSAGRNALGATAIAAPASRAGPRQSAASDS